MKPYTLEWWMKMHKMAIYEAHQKIVRSEMDYYIGIADWIAERVTEKYGEKS